jgi:hypothetical protein
MRDDKLPVSFRDVTGEHHCLSRGTQNADAVFGYSNAGMFILRAHDVIGVIGFEVGSEFFVQNFCTLIGAESLWVPTEVRDKALVTEDEVILGVHKFNVLGSGEAVNEDGKVFGAGDASGAYFAG